MVDYLLTSNSESVNTSIPGLSRGYFQEGLSPSEAVRRYRHAASYLPPDAHRQFDEAIISVGDQPLTLVARLMALGLTSKITDWVATTELGSLRVARSGSAIRAMVPTARAEYSKDLYDKVIVPVFCTFDKWRYNVREVAQWLRYGQPLDLQKAKTGTRNVNESVEDQAILGAGFTVAGHAAPGLLSSPNSFTFADGKMWSDPTKTGAGILADFKVAVLELQANGFYGPYALITGSDDGAALGDDFKANGDKTTLERIRQIEYQGRPTEHIVVRGVPAGTIAVMELSSRVVDVSVGLEPTPLTWQVGHIFADIEGMTLGCTVTRYFENTNGDWGVVIGHN